MVAENRSQTAPGAFWGWQRAPIRSVRVTPVALAATAAATLHARHVHAHRRLACCFWIMFPPESVNWTRTLENRDNPLEFHSATNYCHIFRS